MLNRKIGRKTTILVVSGVIVLILLIGSGIFFWKSRVKNQLSNSTSSNPPAKNLDNDPNDKDLIEKIKTDLKERIERVKNGSRVFEDIMPYIWNKEKVVCQVEGLDFIKEGETFSSADIGAENFQSIINLNKQIVLVRKEWEEKKRQEAQKKADANHNLFYFPCKGSFIGEILTDEISHWQFDGRQDGKNFKLIIPVLHPNLANISIKSDDWNIYQITGVENIPLVPHPLGNVKDWLYKIIKPENQITIKPYQP